MLARYTGCRWVRTLYQDHTRTVLASIFLFLIMIVYGFWQINWLWRHRAKTNWIQFPLCGRGLNVLSACASLYTYTFNFLCANKIVWCDWWTTERIGLCWNHWYKCIDFPCIYCILSQSNSLEKEFVLTKILENARSLVAIAYKAFIKYHCVFIIYICAIAYHLSWKNYTSIAASPIYQKQF